jgi:hypothetical protein
MIANIAELVFWLLQFAMVARCGAISLMSRWDKLSYKRDRKRLMRWLTETTADFDRRN